MIACGLAGFVFYYYYFYLLYFTTRFQNYSFSLFIQQVFFKHLLYARCLRCIYHAVDFQDSSMNNGAKNICLYGANIKKSRPKKKVNYIL